MSCLVTPGDEAVLLLPVKPKYCYDKSLLDKQWRKQSTIEPEYSKKQPKLVNASIIEVERIANAFKLP